MIWTPSIKQAYKNAILMWGKLAPDGLSWVIDETKRNVHRSENNTRIIKLVSLDGEYILLGRQTVDVTNIFCAVWTGCHADF